MANESSLKRNRRKSEMTDDERVRALQRKLYRKAKEEERYRFYVLYDKVCLPYVLREAYRRVKANHGAPGVDGVTFIDIEAAGEGEFIEAIREELVEKSYRPSPVKRKMIRDTAENKRRSSVKNGRSAFGIVVNTNRWFDR